MAIRATDRRLHRRLSRWNNINPNVVKKYLVNLEGTARIFLAFRARLAGVRVFAYPRSRFKLLLFVPYATYCLCGTPVRVRIIPSQSAKIENARRRYILPYRLKDAR